MRLRVPLLTLFSLSALAACGKAPVAPQGFAPLDPTNQASLPAATASAQFPEQIKTVNGHDTMTGYDWADGEGYVSAPVTTVWKALQNASVVANRRELSSWMITKTNVYATADVSFLLTNVTQQEGLQFVIEWREAATVGTVNAPRTVIIRGDLSQSAMILGEDIMTVLSDSIVLTVVNDQTTAYAAIRHRGPDAGSSPAACTQYVTDVYNSVVATVHGQPLPTY
jgi:hypothetical protein